MNINDNYRKLIANGNTDLLIEELLNNKSKHSDEIVLIISRWNELKKQNIKGIISQADFELERNKINNSLLIALKNDDNSSSNSLRTKDRVFNYLYDNKEISLFFIICIAIFISTFIISKENLNPNSPWYLFYEFIAKINLNDLIWLFFVIGFIVLLVQMINKINNNLNALSILLLSFTGSLVIYFLIFGLDIYGIVILLFTISLFFVGKTFISNLKLFNAISVAIVISAVFVLYWINEIKYLSLIGIGYLNGIIVSTIYQIVKSMKNKNN